LTYPHLFGQPISALYTASVFYGIPVRTGMRRTIVLLVSGQETEDNKMHFWLHSVVQSSMSHCAHRHMKLAIKPASGRPMYQQRKCSTQRCLTREQKLGSKKNQTC